MKLQAQSTLGGAFGASHPVSGFESKAAILRERADIGTVMLTTSVEPGVIAETAGRVAGVEIPLSPGPLTSAPGRWGLWLQPRSWLIRCGVDEELDLVKRLNGAFPERQAHAVAFTDAICWFELSGTAAHDILTEGGFVSLERGGLPIGNAKRTLIAQVAAIVVREGESAWLVAVERSRANYFAQWLSAAAKER
jgi:heterotetrameric sarcosine oxidase gamma subunit